MKVNYCNFKKTILRVHVYIQIGTNIDAASFFAISLKELHLFLVLLIPITANDTQISVHKGP